MPQAQQSVLTSDLHGPPPTFHVLPGAPARSQGCRTPLPYRFPEKGQPPSAPPKDLDPDFSPAVLSAAAGAGCSSEPRVLPRTQPVRDGGD